MITRTAQRRAAELLAAFLRRCGKPVSRSTRTGPKPFCEPRACRQRGVQASRGSAASR